MGSLKAQYLLFLQGNKVSAIASAMSRKSSSSVGFRLAECTQVNMIRVLYMNITSREQLEDS